MAHSHENEMLHGRHRWVQRQDGTWGYESVKEEILQDEERILAEEKIIAEQEERILRFLNRPQSATLTLIAN